MTFEMKLAEEGRRKRAEGNVEAWALSVEAAVKKYGVPVEAAMDDFKVPPEYRKAVLEQLPQ